MKFKQGMLYFSRGACLIQVLNSNKTTHSDNLASTSHSVLGPQH